MNAPPAITVPPNRTYEICVTAYLFSGTDCDLRIQYEQHGIEQVLDVVITGTQLNQIAPQRFPFRDCVIKLISVRSRATGWTVTSHENINVWLNDITTGTRVFLMNLICSPLYPHVAATWPVYNPEAQRMRNRAIVTEGVSTGGIGPWEYPLLPNSQACEILGFNGEIQTDANVANRYIEWWIGQSTSYNEGGICTIAIPASSTIEFRTTRQKIPAFQEGNTIWIPFEPLFCNTLNFIQFWIRNIQAADQFTSLFVVTIPEANIESNFP